MKEQITRRERPRGTKENNEKGRILKKGGLGEKRGKL